MHKVAIILGYYNGGNYIKDQLHSIFEQKDVNTTVYIFDDESPHPIDIRNLGIELSNLDRVKITRREKNVGFSQNFLLGLGEAPDFYDFYAYSDQDDIWDLDKLSAAIRCLEFAEKDTPALYCSRSRLVDQSGKQFGLSPLFKKNPCFSNAIVQNIGGGNTMLFNKLARDVILSMSQGVSVVSHDWWSYLVISGAGGRVIYDSTPHLSYRQHDSNVVGSNVGTLNSFVRLRLLYLGRFQEWNDLHCSSLKKHLHVLTSENRALLDKFCSIRRGNSFKAVSFFWRANIRRQSALSQFALLLALLFKKV